MFRSVSKVGRNWHQSLVKNANYSLTSFLPQTSLQLSSKRESASPRHFVKHALFGNPRCLNTAAWKPASLYEHILKMGSENQKKPEKKSAESNESPSSGEQEDKNKPEKEEENKDPEDEELKKYEEERRNFHKTNMQLMQDIETVRLGAAEVTDRELNPEEIQDRLVIYEMDDDQRTSARRSFYYNAFVAGVACPTTLLLTLTQVPNLPLKVLMGAFVCFTSFKSFVRGVSAATAVTSIEMVWTTPDLSKQSSEDAAKKVVEGQLTDTAVKGSSVEEPHMNEHQLRKVHYKQIAEEAERDAETAKKVLEQDSESTTEKSKAYSGVVEASDSAPSMHDALAQKQRKEQELKVKSESESTKAAEGDKTDVDAAVSEEDKTNKNEKADEEEDSGLPDHIIIRRVARIFNKRQENVLDLNQVVFATSYPQILSDEDITQTVLDNDREKGSRGFVLLLSLRGVPIQCFFDYVVHDEAFLQLLKAAKYNFKYLLERGRTLHQDDEKTQ